MITKKRVKGEEKKGRDVLVERERERVVGSEASALLREMSKHKKQGEMVFSLTQLINSLLFWLILDF